MGQGDVISFLEKQKEPVTRGEIALGLHQDPNKISDTIRRMLKWGEIKFIEIDRFEAIIRCGAKRRIRLYFVE